MINSYILNDKLDKIIANQNEILKLIKNKQYIYAWL